MFLEKKDRKIIPRWRDFLTTVALGELDSPAEPGQVLLANDFLDEKLAAWRSSPTVWHAADLVGAAFVLGRKEQALEAARFMVSRSPDCPPPAFRLAQKILDRPSDERWVPQLEEETVEGVRRRVHALRTRLREEPRNAVGFVDLARLYTLLGHNEQAARNMRIAVTLGPSNRFVLRSAARFFLHSGDPLYAHRVLRTAADTSSSDPWLLAAEIGVASLAGAGPSTAKAARRILEDGGLSLFSTTELSSALATLELENGKHRIAKQLFRHSLRSPTENSVAQAEWASNHVGGLEIDIDQFQIPRTFEARASQSFSRGDWSTALACSLDWLRDQPFSTRPAALASYLSSTIFEDYDECAKVLRSSLIANPNDLLLTNNLAFALASAGRVEEAEKQLSAVTAQSLDGVDAIALLATSGLVAFRKGVVSEGRSLYHQAMEQARRHSQLRHRALAAIYLAREEILARTPERFQALEQAKAESKNQAGKDIEEVLSRVCRMPIAEEPGP